MAAQRPEVIARRVVRDVMIYTRGVKMRWVPLETVERRLSLADGRATRAALALAEKAGWLTVKDGESLCLTDAGRQLAQRQERSASPSIALARDPDGAARRRRSRVL